MGGVILLPMTAGSEVFALNLPVFNNLKLSLRGVHGHASCGKSLGRERPRHRLRQSRRQPPGYWTSASSIAPDGSGTTFIFTTHMSAISPEWKAGPGVGKSVPTGPSASAARGTKASPPWSSRPSAPLDTSSTVTRLTHHDLPMAELENKSGKYVKSTPESAAAALAAVTMPADLRAWLPDPEGADSYPIVELHLDPRPPELQRRRQGQRAQGRDQLQG